MKQTLRLHALIAIIFCTLITACSAIPQPQTLEQKLAYAYGTHTAILNTTLLLVKTDKLNIDQANTILYVSDAGKALLELARTSMLAGDTITATAKLALAIAILTDLSGGLTEARK